MKPRRRYKECVNVGMRECFFRMRERVNVRMRFSLDLIYLSGAQGLYRGRTCECVKMNALMCKCVNARICSKFFFNDLKKLRIFAKNFVANIFAIIKC